MTHYLLYKQYFWILMIPTAVGRLLRLLEWNIWHLHMYSGCYESIYVCFTGRRFSIVNLQESEMTLWLLVVGNRDHCPRYVCRNHPSCYEGVSLMALACQYILLFLLLLPIFSHGTTAPCGPGPPHYRGLTITHRHTTLSMTPLNEWSARRTDLYPTTHNTHKRQTCMLPAGSQPTPPAGERS